MNRFSLLQDEWKDRFWIVMDVGGSILLICAIIGGVLRFFDFVQWEFCRFMFWANIW